MALHHRVLGRPGKDNALYLRVDTGQSVHRLLFDCGERCLYGLGRAEIGEIDHVFFSHFHMDHVAGFDAFFRCNYNRPDKPVCVWGPAQTIELMHHRFRSFIWNLVRGSRGRWRVAEVNEREVRAALFRSNDGFRRARPEPAHAFDGIVLRHPDFTVEARIMDHRTPCLAYLVREPARTNVDKDALDTLGIPPGPWVRDVKDEALPDDQPVEWPGGRSTLGALREQLLVEHAGESLAYLTDFKLDAAGRERLLPMIEGCNTIVCESQYAPEDRALAEGNYHLDVTQAAALARDAGAGKLVLFHVSDRYPAWRLIEMLDEARAVFPAAYYPEGWPELLRHWARRNAAAPS